MFQQNSVASFWPVISRESQDFHKFHHKGLLSWNGDVNEVQSDSLTVFRWFIDWFRAGTDTDKFASPNKVHASVHTHTHWDFHRFKKHSNSSTIYIYACHIHYMNPSFMITLLSCSHDFSFRNGPASNWTEINFGEIPALASSSTETEALKLFLTMWVLTRRENGCSFSMTLVLQQTLMLQQPNKKKRVKDNNRGRKIGEGGM